MEPSAQSGEARTFYLDVQPVAEWRPLANAHETMGLRLEPGFAYEIEDFVEIDGHQDDVVGPAIGKALTTIDFFGWAENGEVLAARMKFGEYGFAVACGDIAFDTKRNKTEFRCFGMDETFLWSEEQFSGMLAKCPLEHLTTLKA